MIGRFFRRSRPDTAVAAWWREAHAVAQQPTAEAIDRLRTPADPTVSPDETENRTEMIEGLERLLVVAGAEALPTLTTQHRVIGPDTCHFMTPVSLPGAADAPGKLFVTDRRLIVSGGSVTALPWHRIRQVSREGRELIAGGGDHAIHVQCNSYGDALVVHHLATRLGPQPRRETGA